MTIGAWFLFIVVAIMILGAGVSVAVMCDSVAAKIISAFIAFILIAVLFWGLSWYYRNTASGQRALIDQKSELNNGLERTVTVYTADGEVLAQYTGNIDIEGNDGGYVLFDYNGKRYTYYNCFVESVAEIE